jgi:O-antigen ligase
MCGRQQTEREPSVNVTPARTPHPVWRWWLIAVFSIPLLVPYRWLPTPSFWQELTAFVLAAAAAAMLAWPPARSGESRFELATVAWTPILLGLVLAIQQLLGRITYVQHFVLPFLAFLLAALAADVAYHRCRKDLADAVSAIAGALVIVGLVQSAWTLVQLAGYELKGFDLIERAPGPFRVGGLIAQPNQLSVLLVWGLLGGFYLWWRGRLPSIAAALAATCFLLVLSLAASRATYVYLLVLGPSLSWLLFRMGRPRGWWWPMLVAITYPFVDLIVRAGIQVAEPLASAEIVRPLDGASMAARLAFIRDGWQLFLSSPLLGVGWHQFISARWGLSDATLLELHADHAHNIVINLLAETGVTGFAIVIVGLLLWLRRVVSVQWSVERLIVLAMLTTMALYSLFEFPLWQGYFLIPVAVLCGLLETEHTNFRVSAGFSRLGKAMSMLLPALVLASAVDYYRVETFYRAYFRDGKTELPRLESVIALTNATLYRQQAEQIYLLAAPIDSFHASFNADMSARVFVGFPAPQFAVVRAAYLVYAGDFAQASYVLGRTCKWLESSCVEMRRRFEWLASNNGEPFMTFKAQHLDQALPAIHVRALPHLGGTQVP